MQAAGGGTSDTTTNLPPIIVEPISPELALIDPVLREREIASTRHRTNTATFDDADHPDRETCLDLITRSIGTPAHWGVAALAASLLFNAFLLSSRFAPAVTGERQVAISERQPLVTMTGSTVAPAPTEARAAGSELQRTRKRATAGRGASKAEAERQVLALVHGDHRADLSRRLIDPSTGLLRNNVQSACTDGALPGAYLCVIRPPGHTRNGLYVSYRRISGKRPQIVWHGWSNTGCSSQRGWCTRGQDRRLLTP